MSALRSLLRANRGFIALLLAFGLLRTAVADYNPVPSGSMRPTILEGDVVLVNRLAYDFKLPLTEIVIGHLGDPRRGDIVTFSSPKDGVRLIKRVIGLPGDVISMRNERLEVNGLPVRYQLLGTHTEELGGGQEFLAEEALEQLGRGSHDVQWLIGRSNAANFGPVTIPAGQYLMLGDNRDDSADSRYIGLVPRRLLIAKALRVLVSADFTAHPHIRLERFGMSLYRQEAAQGASF
jgi:signal peptidase I